MPNGHSVKLTWNQLRSRKRAQLILLTAHKLSKMRTWGDEAFRYETVRFSDNHLLTTQTIDGLPPNINRFN